MQIDAGNTSHVVSAGFNYVSAIRNWLGENVEYSISKDLQSISEYDSALGNMFGLAVRLFEEHPDIQLEQNTEDLKITSRWKQKYDVEQMMEHAIVHILRHRRQIEIMKYKF